MWGKMEKRRGSGGNSPGQQPAAYSNLALLAVGPHIDSGCSSLSTSWDPKKVARFVKSVGDPEEREREIYIYTDLLL